MGGSGGLRLGEDSVGVGLIGRREVDGGVGRRRRSASWGLDRLGSMTLRPAETWVEEHGVCERERERGILMFFNHWYRIK